ncbi:30S ribosomal protein S4 [Anaplasmataceae bacterium AB001_6]|nr:30S ribosomal protein S4 [Anaplasmataceae bacterium AB001_6]
MTVRFRRYFRVSRKLGLDIWGIQKDPVNKRNYRPGVHGHSVSRKTSDYGRQLSAQLAIRTHYGIKQYQLKKLYILAERMKGNTIDNLVALLESRLSSVLFRAGIYPTMRSAQISVSHKHILVDGKPINSSSYMLKAGNSVEVVENQKNSQIVLQGVDNKNIPAVDYLDIDKEKRKITYLRNPDYSEVPYAFQSEMHLVIEFFSKMV